MTHQATDSLEKIVARYVGAAQGGQKHAEEVIADQVDGVPVAEVERALAAAGLEFHRIPLRLHYRAPGEMPRLVLGRKH